MKSWSATEAPIPPPELMFRVSGGTDSTYFLESGKATRDDFARGLATVGRSFKDFNRILDFGCGCGRVLRWLREDISASRLAGSDIDQPAVEWLRSRMLGVLVRANESLPPLSFEKGSFDLVLAYSIFSHLDERYQDAWLTELHRVTQPGGILLITVHGHYNWNYTKETIFPKRPDLAALDPTFRENGFLYWKGDGWEKHFPDFYHTAWHSPIYVREHWSRWFDVLELREAGARPTQDLVVLRKR